MQKRARPPQAVSSRASVETSVRSQGSVRRGSGWSAASAAAVSDVGSGSRCQYSMRASATPMRALYMCGGLSSLMATLGAPVPGKSGRCKACSAARVTRAAAPAPLSSVSRGGGGWASASQREVLGSARCARCSTRLSIGHLASSTKGKKKNGMAA